MPFNGGRQLSEAGLLGFDAGSFKDGLSNLTEVPPHHIGLYTNITSGGNTTKWRQLRADSTFFVSRAAAEFERVPSPEVVATRLSALTPAYFDELPWLDALGNGAQVISITVIGPDVLVGSYPISSPPSASPLYPPQIPPSGTIPVSPSFPHKPSSFPSMPCHSPLPPLPSNSPPYSPIVPVPSEPPTPPATPTPPQAPTPPTVPFPGVTASFGPLSAQQLSPEGALLVAFFTALALPLASVFYLFCRRRETELNGTKPTISDAIDTELKRDQPCDQKGLSMRQCTFSCRSRRATRTYLDPFGIADDPPDSSWFKLSFASRAESAPATGADLMVTQGQHRAATAMQQPSAIRRTPRSRIELRRSTQSRPRMQSVPPAFGRGALHGKASWFNVSSGTLQSAYSCNYVTGDENNTADPSVVGAHPSVLPTSALLGLSSSSTLEGIEVYLASSSSIAIVSPTSLASDSPISYPGDRLSLLLPPMTSPDVTSLQQGSAAERATARSETALARARARARARAEAETGAENPSSSLGRAGSGSTVAAQQDWLAATMAAVAVQEDLQHQPVAVQQDWLAMRIAQMGSSSSMSDGESSPSRSPPITQSPRAYGIPFTPRT